MHNGWAASHLGRMEARTHSRLRCWFQLKLGLVAGMPRAGLELMSQGLAETGIDLVPRFRISSLNSLHPYSTQAYSEPLVLKMLNK